MDALLGGTIDEAEAFECSYDGEVEVSLVVLRLHGYSLVHRFFLDAGLACWEALEQEAAVADFEGCARVALELAGAEVLAAECVRVGRVDELRWTTSRGRLRMFFSDPDEPESSCRLELDGAVVRAGPRR